MKISVVIPTCNRCELLKRALLSVFSQSLLPTEVTVIDDGSTDGTNAMMGKKYAKKGGWIFTQCLPHCAMSPSTVMIHRSVFEDIGLFDTRFPACEDYDLWLRIAANYPVLLIEEPQIKKYGGHENQLSQKLWGMDRFRINALQHIVDTDQLST